MLAREEELEHVVEPARYLAVVGRAFRTWEEVLGLLVQTADCGFCSEVPNIRCTHVLPAYRGVVHDKGQSQGQVGVAFA